MPIKASVATFAYVSTTNGSRVTLRHKASKHRTHHRFTL